MGGASIFAILSHPVILACLGFFFIFGFLTLCFTYRNDIKKGFKKIMNKLVKKLGNIRKYKIIKKNTWL